MLVCSALRDRECVTVTEDTTSSGQSPTPISRSKDPPDGSVLVCAEATAVCVTHVLLLSPDRLADCANEKPQQPRLPEYPPAPGPVTPATAPATRYLLLGIGLFIALVVAWKWFRVGR